MREGLLGASFMFVACMVVLYIIDVFMRRSERKAR